MDSTTRTRSRSRLPLRSFLSSGSLASVLVFGNLAVTAVGQEREEAEAREAKPHPPEEEGDEELLSESKEATLFVWQRNAF